jgi:hypothetical protein
MLLGTLHPAIRLAVGVVIVVIGIAMHKVFLDVIGGAVVALSAFQWMTRQRGFTGSKDLRQ